MYISNGGFNIVTRYSTNTATNLTWAKPYFDGTTYQQRKGTPTMRRDDIRARLASLEAELNELDKWGDDTYPDGTVIKWKKTFPPAKIKYRFAALKAKDFWYLTNRDGYRLTWDDLVKMLSHKDSFDHKVAKGWKRL